MPYTFYMLVHNKHVYKLSKSAKLLSETYEHCEKVEELLTSTYYIPDYKENYGIKYIKD